MLSRLPTRALSRAWGYMTALEVPNMIRPVVYGLYGAVFGVNFSEVELPLSDYASLSTFFRRHLKPGSRHIHPTADLVSPVDGRVLTFGEVFEGKYIEQVKGCRFTLEEFLGSDAAELIKRQREESPAHNSAGKKLFYCVIYLAPGDYHGVHSPVEWTIKEARHFPGDLFSVSPLAVQLIEPLFALNERLALNGHWQHGFFSLTSVGAFNVGSINVEFDPSLQTNLEGQTYTEVAYEEVQPKRGDCIAFFNFGSTVVLLFEAPDFSFHISKKERVKMGQSLGEIQSNRANASSRGRQ
eukprot:TRINITY_DN1279_c0_g1_i5.p1 TRINITY_DN1279_c0_g1~~TRINITY_DN1279_c0_g1_i5.p1  ORF type:complete len:297 (+),score=65.68 TRINITY_DN1279_c0_g1_i5:120-1010(+)